MSNARKPQAPPDPEPTASEPEEIDLDAELEADAAELEAKNRPIRIKVAGEHMEFLNPMFWDWEVYEWISQGDLFSVIPRILPDAGHMEILRKQPANTVVALFDKLQPLGGVAPQDFQKPERGRKRTQRR